MRCRVEMTSRPNVPAIFPPASSIIRSAASHPPGPLERVPRPHRYYQPTPTSRPPSRLASFPSLGTTTASPSFAPPGSDDSPWAWTTSWCFQLPPPHSSPPAYTSLELLPAQRPPLLLAAKRICGHGSAWSPGRPFGNPRQTHIEQPYILSNLLPGGSADSSHRSLDTAFPFSP